MNEAVTLPHLNIVLLKEAQHTLIVLKGDLLRLWESLQWGHVSSARCECLQDVLGQACRVQLEVGLEKKVGYIVDTPFSR